AGAGRAESLPRGAQHVRRRAGGRHDRRRHGLRAREPLGLSAGADDGGAPLRGARGERDRPAVVRGAAGKRRRRRVRRRPMTRRLAVAALVMLAGCGTTPRLPPPPTGVAAVGVAPVENKTGNKLVISGDSYVAKWIGWEKKTVPDVLAKELETTL